MLDVSSTVSSMRTDSYSSQIMGYDDKTQTQCREEEFSKRRGNGLASHNASVGSRSDFCKHSQCREETVLNDSL